MSLILCWNIVIALLDISFVHSPTWEYILLTVNTAHANIHPVLQFKGSVKPEKKMVDTSIIWPWHTVGDVFKVNLKSL